MFSRRSHLIKLAPLQLLRVRNVPLRCYEKGRLRVAPQSHQHASVASRNEEGWNREGVVMYSEQSLVWSWAFLL